MSRRISIGVSALWVILSIAACEEAPRKVKKLTEKDKGNTVKINIRDVLEVVLKENPTTGYSWKVASVDESILKQADGKQFKTDSNRTGAGGRMTMRFRAVKVGKTRLDLT